MGDREHPRHLDPRKLALNDGGVPDVEGPEQKPVSFDPRLVRLHTSRHTSAVPVLVASRTLAQANDHGGSG